MKSRNYLPIYAKPPRIIGVLLTPLLFSLGCDAVRAIPDERDDTRVVEVALFEGGYGIHWHKKIADQYVATVAAENVAINLWGDQRVAEKVKPRILRGDPPELLLAGGMPVWLLIAQNKLYPFDEALDQVAYGSSQTWRSQFFPGILDSYTSDGKVYALPSSFSIWACWYDARQFREHGWEVPKTWGEFTKLCERIRGEGIAPVAFQGKYPLYAYWTLISLIQRCGGLAAINRLNMFEKGAWEHPDVIWAARLLQEMSLNHYQKGAMGMSHTDSQLEFVNGNAAMIFCGVYLENEMRDSIPPGFEMRSFNVPAVEGGKGNPKLFHGEGGEYLFLFTDSNYPELGADFARYMISPENAPDMAKTIGSISPLGGAVPPEAVSPALQSALDMINEAPGIFNSRAYTLFLNWTNESVVPGLAALMLGDVTPEAFCHDLGADLETAMANMDQPIPDYVPVDPAAFGESP